MTKTLLLIGGGVLAYGLLAKGRALGTVNFYPDQARSFNLDGSTPVLRIGIRVQNTTSQKFIIRSIAGNVYANSYLVGNVGYFTPFTINPNSQATLLVDIRFALIGVVQDIITAFQTHSFSQTVNLEANANVDNFQIPVDLTYKIGA